MGTPPITPPITPFPLDDGSPDWAQRTLERVRVGLRTGVIAAQRETESRLLGWDELADGSAGILYSTFGDHVGLPADVLDGRARFAATQSLMRTFGGRVHVSGEEDLTTVAIAPLELLVVVDPIDGTSPAKHLGAAHSSVALCYLRLEDGFRLLASAIAGPSNIVVTWRSDGVVEAGLTTHGPQADRRVPLNPAANAIAVAAYKPQPEARAGDAPSLVRGCRPAVYADVLQGHEEFFVYNTAGTPATWALIGLELGAIICRSAQTPWDAAYLLPLMDVGGVALDESGEVGRDEVIAWFEGFSLDGSERLKPVPPHIAAVSPAFAELVARHYPLTLDGW